MLTPGIDTQWCQGFNPWGYTRKKIKHVYRSLAAKSREKWLLQWTGRKHSQPCFIRIGIFWGPAQFEQRSLWKHYLHNACTIWTPINSKETPAKLLIPIEREVYTAHKKVSLFVLIPSQCTVLFCQFLFSAFLFFQEKKNFTHILWKDIFFIMRPFLSQFSWKI